MSGAHGLDLIMIGAGGHARAVMGVALSAGLNVMGCISACPDDPPVLGVPVIGGDSDLAILHARGVRRAIVAIGNNAQRVRASNYLLSLGFELQEVISAHAIVGRLVTLGRGAVIMPGAIVNGPTKIGDFPLLNTGSRIDHDCVIGVGVHIAPGATICGSVQIGDGAFVGANAVVTPERTIGARATIGAGSVVIRSVRDDAIVIGNPARERLQ